MSVVMENEPTIANNTLPTGWKWVRLEDICEINPARPRGLSVGANDIVSFVPMEAVDARSGCITDLQSREYSEVSNGYTYFEEGDVLFAKITPCMQNGKHSVAQHLLNGFGFGTTEFHVVRPHKEVASEWVHMFLRQPGVLFLAEQSFTGAVGQQRVPKEFLRTLPIPLPPLPEQKRIAAILNEQMAAVEKARAACEAQLEAAKILPAAYLRSVFESEEAKKWERIPLGNLCSIEAQLVDPKIQQYCDMPHISSENIVGGECRLQNIRTALEDGMTSGKFLFRCGDVLYSKIRPYLRKAAKVDFTGLCSADIYPLHVNTSKLDSEFLLWLLVSDGFTSYADEESRRARMPKLNKEQLFAYKAPLPNIHQQQQIAQDINKQVGACYNLKVKLEAQLVEISRLPSAILRKAFRGEL